MEKIIVIVICLMKGGKLFRGHDKSKISIKRELLLDFVDLLMKYNPI